MTRWALLALLVVAAACRTKPATQLLVAVGTDIEVGDPLEQIEVEVGPADGASVFSRRTILVSRNPMPPFTVAMPFSFGVVPQDDDASRQVRVVARGRFRASGRRDRVVVTAITGFIEERSLLLPLYLQQRCVDVLECADGFTCRDGMCVDARVATATLREVGAGFDLGLAFDASRPDVGADVATDVTEDVGADVTSVVTPDVITDAGIDAGADVAVDAGFDVAPDLRSDVDPTDAGVDVVDVAVDAGVDAGTVAPDVTRRDSTTSSDAVTLMDIGPSDAGPGDAGFMDTGPGDAGFIDTGFGDAGFMDTGPADAGFMDAGPSDAGSSDAGGSEVDVIDAVIDTGGIVRDLPVIFDDAGEGAVGARSYGRHLVVNGLDPWPRAGRRWLPRPPRLRRVGRRRLHRAARRRFERARPRPRAVSLAPR